MGFMICFGPCISCGVTFGFNPLSVPSSSAVTGEREPICKACVDRLNVIRKDRDLPLIVPHPDAYEPAEE